MSDEKRLSAPLRLLLRTVGNVALTWVMATFLPQYFFVTGGLAAYVVIGSLLTLMNILVRPALVVIAFPLKLFATILALILVNGVFIWVTYEIMLLMDPDIVLLEIGGGVIGWIVVAVGFGLGNWLLKAVLK